MDVLSPRQQRLAHLSEKLRRELGPIVVDALTDPDVIEIMVNPGGEVWLERVSSGMQPTGVVLPESQIELAIGTVAALLDQVINKDYPRLQGELPLDGSRFQGMIPPVSRPTFVIRKPARLLYRLPDYVEAGILEAWQAEAIRAAIAARRNLVIAGGTGSGKTTLANAVLDEIVRQSGPHERFVMIEDTQELRCAAANTVQLHTCEAADLRALVQATMRLRPDRIIIGEVRGAEALELLKAWNTGHPGGVTTVHADTAASALVRLEMLIEEAGVQPNLRLIGSTVHLIVLIERWGRGRRVTDLVRVEGWDPATQQYRLTPIHPQEEVSYATSIAVTNGALAHGVGAAEPDARVGGRGGDRVALGSTADHGQ